MSLIITNKYMVKDTLTGSYKALIWLCAPSADHLVIKRDVKHLLTGDNEFSKFAKDLQLFYVGSIDLVTGKEHLLESHEFVANLQELKIQAMNDFLNEQKQVLPEPDVANDHPNFKGLKKG